MVGNGNKSERLISRRTLCVISASKTVVIHQPIPFTMYENYPMGEHIIGVISKVCVPLVIHGFMPKKKTTGNYQG